MRPLILGFLLILFLACSTEPLNQSQNPDNLSIEQGIIQDLKSLNQSAQYGLSQEEVDLLQAQGLNESMIPYLIRKGD